MVHERFCAMPPITEFCPIRMNKTARYEFLLTDG